MACPFFHPGAPASGDSRPSPARSPLGTIFDGICHAQDDLPFHPDGTTTYEFCNFGYVRGKCSRFPEDSDADAVRLSLDRNGVVVYVIEKDYSPIRFGQLDDAPAVVKRQANVWRGQIH